MIRLLQEKPMATLILGSGSSGILGPNTACLGIVQPDYIKLGSVA